MRWGNGLGLAVIVASLAACTTPTDPGGGTTTTTPSSSTTTTTAAPPTTTTPTKPPTTTTTTPSTTTTTTALPPASSWPTAATTGVTNPGALTTWTGSCEITTPSAVIENKVFNCAVKVNVTGVTIRNSVVHGDAYYGIQNRADSGAPLTVEDVTIAPAGECRADVVAIGDANYHATRVEVTGFGDAWRASDTGNVVVRDSYTKLCAPIGTDAHSDGLQGYMAPDATPDRPLVLDHNTIDQRCFDWTILGGTSVHFPGSGNPADQGCEATANVFWWDDSGDGLVVTDNLFRGGGYTIRVETGSGHTVRGNVVERNSYGYGPVYSHCASITWTGNRLADVSEAGVASNFAPLPCTNDG